ncbi:MAG: hypothetical protein Q8K79_11805 [Solirubrobacteraceae bacterium]|nr:hypothetical protein [Solirubrobacteraceae bacterium]
MSALRRALAVLCLGALGTAAAAPAGAATLTTAACVPYVRDQPTMTIIGTGFTPGGSVTLASATKSKPAPAPFATSTVLPNGNFVTRTMPPPFSSRRRTQESFTLVGLDATNPAAFGTTLFEVVRFGLTTSPMPRLPTSRVRYTARGFTPGKRVYVHFRFRGVTRRTVSLGVAKGPCGIASRRMRALPTQALYGPWTTYTNQFRTAPRKKPYWQDAFEICRGRC